MILEVVVEVEVVAVVILLSFEGLSRGACCILLLASSRC